MDWNVAGMENIRIIAHIYTDFDEKFGIPRQSGIVKQCRGRIVFEPEYRNEEALAGIDGYSHLWLIWKFSESVRQEWSPTVRPPRLGGNKRVGVFATRSPFRPNPMGLSSVRLEEVITDSTDGPQLIVSGVDMLNKTPIYDIKPYLAYADAYPDARSGFGAKVKDHVLEVEFPEKWLEMVEETKRPGAIEMLRQDPRPPYHNHAEQIYKIAFANVDIHFTVEDNKLTVCRVLSLEEGQKK